MVACGTVAAALAGQRLTAAPKPAAASGPKHLTDALALVDGLSAQQNAGNAYSYTLPPTVTWAGPTVANSSDCSSFVTALLMHSYKLSAANVQALAGTTKASGAIKSWPQSATWYTAVANGTPGSCLAAVPSLAAVRPGDLIFVKYLDGNASGDTGHCMLVAAAPVAMSATAAPVVAGCREWSVQVVDVTGSPHTSDTRYHGNADGTSASGAGVGTIRVYVNGGDGSTAGHSWGLSSASVFESVAVRPMVFARPDPAALAAVAAGGAIQPVVRVAGPVTAVPAGGPTFGPIAN